MNHYMVDVLTPYKVVAKDVPCESLLIPTVNGQINVLEGHTHVISELTTGQLSIFGGADDPDRHFTVTKGICKVLNDRVTILSNTSEENFEIDAERAKLAMANAEEELRTKDDLSDEEIEKFRRKVERAKLRVQLSEYTRNRDI